MRFQLYLVIGFLMGCSGEPESEVNDNPIVNEDTTTVDVDSSSIEIVEEVYIVDTLEQKLIDAGLVDIQTIIPGLLIDVRYSSNNNFMEQDVYGHLNRIYLQPDIADDLLKCQLKLKEIDSTLTLLVFDGVRPRSVQQIMWDVLDMPINEKTKFVSNPKNGSVHNYGAAVDLTIAHEDGTPLDMGAEYDDIRKIAYPRYEKAYLDSGMLTTTHIENRDLLRSVMRAGGFWGIQTEWWHFNRYSRAKCQEMYEIVE